MKTLLVWSLLAYVVIGIGYLAASMILILVGDLFHVLTIL